MDKEESGITFMENNNKKLYDVYNSIQKNKFQNIQYV